MISGHYESIGEEGGYATIVGDSVVSTRHAQVSGTYSTTADSDAAEPTYVAVLSYTKRKSGEVNLRQGSTVSVMQRELSGK